MANPQAKQSSALMSTLDGYETSLRSLESSLAKQELQTVIADKLLVVLLARDDVQKAMDNKEAITPDGVQCLVSLDARLKTIAAITDVEELLSDIRWSLRPDDKYRWWYLDQEDTYRKAHRKLIWRLGTIFLFIITGALALEIMKRLWVATPDALAFIGSLVTVALTSSAFTAQGREVGQWVIERLPILKERFRVEAMFVMAVIAAGLMLFFWWWGMPQLARYYNQRGLLAMNRSKPDLLEAGGDFQRAAAIDPDAAPPYDNLGKAYEAAGLLDEAEVWYRQALERDPNFSPVYSDLGRMYILQHKLETAIWLLSAGLRVAEQNNALKEPIRYRLLQNLGWAYYAAGAYDLAQAKLEEAISLEKDNANAVGITAPPHYYLALTLEALKEPELACEHWDLSWRYPDNDFLYQAGWEQTIQERIQKCEEKNP